jgi:hypothetical protein
MKPQQHDDLLARATDQIRNSPIPAGPSEDLMNQTLDRLAAAPRPQPSKQGNLFMKTIAKLAVAAVVLFVVFVGWNLLDKSGSSGVLWAEVVEQISNHTKYKCRQSIVRNQGPQVPVMTVYHLNLSQRRQEVEDGSIHVIDMRGQDAVTLELHPDTRKALVEKMLGFGPTNDPDIIEMVKRFDQQAVERLGTKTENGKTLYGFRHKPDANNDFTVWVDAKTKLPVEVRITHTQVPQTITLDQFEFDFDLDPSVFSTEVPEGYTVETIELDYRTVEPKEITAAELRSGLHHTAYAVGNLPWIEKMCTLAVSDPLGTKAIDFVTGILCRDGNVLLLVQGNYYDPARMVWIPQQKLVLETPGGVKSYNHPNGAIYAQLFLESFARARPDYFSMSNLSDERATRMIVLPDGTILGLAANKSLSNDTLRELVEALNEIKAE